MALNDDQLATFEAEYCPPIDPSLLRSILSDYVNLDDAREVLDSLKVSAEVEELALADTASSVIDGDASEGRRTSNSNHDANHGQSVGTDQTSVSDDLATTGPLYQQAEKSCTEDALFQDLDNLDEETKLQVLLSLFGDQLAKHTIQFALRTSNGRFNAAMEQLLNQVYFQDTVKNDENSHVTFKGIDAFAEHNMARPKSKQKPGGKNRKTFPHGSRDVGTLDHAQDGGIQNNKWKSSQKDIDFIADRMHLSAASVSSLYHESGASVPRTIQTLLDQHIPVGPSRNSAENTMIEKHANELRLEFPTLSDQHATALVQITHPSTAAAHELAKALASSRANVSIGGLQIIPRYAPLADSVDGGSLPAASVAMAARSRPGDATRAVERAHDYTNRSQLAFAQAGNAHRMSKSNPLMGGAAAYYAAVRREYSALAHQALADVADGTADVQSSPLQLDLHNIDVLNAVRIARLRTQEWWDGLGENRFNGRIGAQDRAKGFSIIVGRGIHSQGGKARVGPAVMKMLREDGWKFENIGGALIVKGRVTK